MVRGPRSGCLHDGTVVFGHPVRGGGRGYVWFQTARFVLLLLWARNDSDGGVACARGSCRGARWRSKPDIDLVCGFPSQRIRDEVL